MTENDIIEYYKDNHSVKNTAYFFNITQHAVYSIINKTVYKRNRKQALAISKYITNKKNQKFDTTVFDVIGPKEAYMLGLFYSDGCVCKTTNKRCISSFGSNDLSLVKNVKKFFKSKNKINKNSKKKLNNKGNPWNPNYNIAFSSEYLFNRLNDLGCIERKSRFIKKPNITEDLYLPFLLGVFDGDGSICYDKKINSWHISIGTASKDFYDWMAEYSSRLGIIFSFEIRKIPSGNFYIIMFTGLSAKVFLDKLYSSANGFIPLKRKNILYNKLCKESFANPRYQLWEIECIKKYPNNRECSDKINKDIRNYGWNRSFVTIRSKRRKLSPDYKGKK